jgi:hypothetical protein
LSASQPFAYFDAAMDWIISISAEESAQGALLPTTRETVVSALSAHGVALLRSVFADSLVDALHQAYVEQFGALDADGMAGRAAAAPPNPCLKVGGRRYEITPRMTGAFADPQVFANPLIAGLLEDLFGDDVRMSAFSVVVSFPGAPPQHIHRDHPQLFPEGELGTVLPAYAINVAAPLIDVDLVAGPTGFWPGSHRWNNARLPSAETITMMPLRRGDCLLLDYRTLHAGLANRASGPRPVLYMVYARRWFADEANYRNRTPLDMSLETFESLPEAVQPLLLRAYSQSMRCRQELQTSGRCN